MQGEKGDVQCKQISSNMARKRQCCICRDRRTGKGTRLHRQIKKLSWDGEVAHHCFCKQRRVGDKGHLCIGKESRDVARVKLQMIDCASTKESERRGKCHVTMTGTMLQGRDCICNRGDSTSAMRRRCRSDEWDCVLPPNTQYQ